MKIVFCKWFPFKGYKAITILKWIIVRKMQRSPLPLWITTTSAYTMNRRKNCYILAFTCFMYWSFSLSSSITASGIRHTGAYPLSVRHTQTSTTQRTL